MPAMIQPKGKAQKVSERLLGKKKKKPSKKRRK